MRIRNKQKTIRLQLQLLRRESSLAAPYRQIIEFETDDLQMTVAGAITAINDAGDYQDIQGNLVTPIAWDCSCLQKKCGACAMVINGVPRLACDCYLKEFKKRITVEPLKKFPVVADLIVDRSVLFENLKKLSLWQQASAEVPDQKNDIVYEASRCLQCGCCLEVCPNFCGEGSFFGAAAFVPVTKLWHALPDEKRDALRAQYEAHIYAGCAKSLSCADICPAGIDTEKMLVRSNAAMLLKGLK